MATITPSILILDDDAELLSILEQTFKNGGFATTATQSYTEAVQHLTDTPFSVLLSDIMMPGHSGIELMKLAATLPAQKDTLFALITNSVSSEFVADAIETRVPIYIQKAENDPKDILATIVKKLGEKK
jgi:CheY-like chemotaxis protein